MACLGPSAHITPNLSARLEIILAFAATCFIPIHVSFVGFIFYFFVRKRWVDSSGSFGDTTVVPFWCFRFFRLCLPSFSSYWAEDDLISCCSLLGWLLPCFPITFYTPVCWYASVYFHWDWSIHQSIVSLDWFIPIGQLIDWSIGCLLAGYGGSFLRCPLLVLLFGALRPWALWPLRISVGPSWLCRADFSDGKIQKLSTISSRLEVTGEYSIWSACKEHCSRTQLTMWYMIFTLGSKICID